MKIGPAVLASLLAIVSLPSPAGTQASEPPAGSQLVELGGFTAPFATRDLGDDPITDLVFAAGVSLSDHWAIVSGLFDAAGPVRGLLRFDAIPFHAMDVNVAGVRVAVSPDVGIGAQPGGVLLAWPAYVHFGPGVNATLLQTRLISLPDLIPGPTATIDNTFWSTAIWPSLAYSVTGRAFLVLWSSCQYGSSECLIFDQPIDVTGQPIGTPREVAQGIFPEVAWNPMTDELGVTYVSLPSYEVVFARVASDGAVRSQITVGRWTRYPPAIAVNSHTGNYVVLWNDAGLSGLFGAEIDSSGALASHGLVSGTMTTTASTAHAIAFNPVSGTFLVVGQTLDTHAYAALELNAHGAPLSAATIQPFSGDGGFVGFNYAVMSRSQAAEWWVARAGYNIRRIDGIGTSTRAGGSALRLGGCTTPDPFSALGTGVCQDGGWLPPGMLTTAPPSSSDCQTSDPFLSLGGGTCRNGGWFPPGMPLPPVLPVVPGGCSTPDPFGALGGGACRNGGWFPPGMPLPPVPPVVPGGCSTSDPFVAMGGGVCRNGGWFPPGMPLPPVLPVVPGGCSTPDPFLSIGGGVCSNGGWRPRG
jgi:hypothetical protein